MPEDFGDLRNISCTLFISKLFERHLQGLIQEEIEIKDNQYGGVKGCSTTHMIIDIMQEICENAEDYRSATVLCAIDYAKAFNRLSYQHCLEAYRRKGSSTPVLRLIASFLTNRTMTVKVGSSWSEPLTVDGGCPQGSILGVHLFNTTTDTLEDEFLEGERARLGLQPGIAQTRCGNAEEERPRVPDPLPNPRASSPDPEAELMPRVPLSPVFCPPSDRESRRPNARRKPLPQPVLLEVPREEKTGTQVLTVKPVKFFKYIDDNVSCARVNFGSIPITIKAGQPIKIKQALPVQNAFRSVTRKAEEIGMVVNASKTNLLCISDALNHRPETFIMDSDNNIIESGQAMKVLGFHFSNKPNADLHVELTTKKIRQRYWILSHLRKIGFDQEELVRVYKSSVLPLADYCCPAYHSMLSDLQDQLFERTQVGALRAIYGYGMTARELRAEANVTTLRERRVFLTDKFAEKCLSSERFRSWFPLAEGRRSGRNTEKYKEFFAKNDRLKNSPLFYMRRRLNGKPGKMYGERNRRYRENFELE